MRDERQVQALIKYHHCGRRKDKILKENTKRYHKRIGTNCEICGTEFGLEVHHVDRNRDNNWPENLMTLCESCHGRVHSQNLLTAYYDEIIEITNVGLREVYDIEMESDYDNFVANGIVVHNCNYSKDKFDNKITVIEPCFYNDIPEELKEDIRCWVDIADIDSMNDAGLPDIARRYAFWYQACSLTSASYMDLLENGATPQEARSVLPNSLKTEVVMTANYREWRNVFKLRCASDAHPQIREIMIPLCQELQRRIPLLFDDCYPIFLSKKFNCTVTERDENGIKLKGGEAELPIIRQPEIVRCEDCRYLNADTGICIVGIPHGYKDTFYCAYGKRRRSWNERILRDECKGIV